MPVLLDPNSCPLEVKPYYKSGQQMFSHIAGTCAEIIIVHS